MSTALLPFLDHPDVGGDDLSPAECASVLVGLDAIIDHWTRADRGQVFRKYVEDACRLARVLRFCVEKDVPLGFT